MTQGLKIVGALCAVSVAVFITAVAFDQREKMPDEIVSADGVVYTARTQGDQVLTVVIWELTMQEVAWAVCAPRMRVEWERDTENIVSSPGIVRDSD